MPDKHLIRKVCYANILFFLCIFSCEKKLLVQPENSDLVTIGYVIKYLPKNKKDKLPKVYTKLSKINSVRSQFNGPVIDAWGNEYFIKIVKNTIFVMSQGRDVSDPEDDRIHQESIFLSQRLSEK